MLECHPRMPDADLAHRILKAVDDGFDEQIQFTRELVSLPSLRGAEASAQDFMARAYRDRGYAVDRFLIDPAAIAHLPGFSPVTVDYDNAWNVVAAHRATNPRGRSLILNGHIDVVPPGPGALWTQPPFAPHVEDSWLYGRGAGDMKAGLVGALYALDALRRAGLQPAADVYLQSVIEEECTGNGALACLARGYRADAAIIPEPTEAFLDSAQLGVMWFQVKILGRPAHAALAGRGANAIEAAWPIVEALHGLEASWNAAPHPVWKHYPHPINFVLAKIEGGDWTSSVPSWCTFDMRIAFYPGMDLTQVREAVEHTVREAARGQPFLANHPPEVRYHGFQAEGYLLHGAEQARAVLDASHRRVTGKALVDRAVTATTDARFFGLYANTPAMVYGPQALDYHAFDERVNLLSVRQVTQAIALFVADWCGVEPR